MCRYAYHAYKPHFACFSCRKTFKRRLNSDLNIPYDQQVSAKCPQCGSLMADMGLDFESPKQKDIKAWKHISLLYKAGFTFHSCGCSGPGYIPKNPEQLLQQLTCIQQDYIEQQQFWSRRKEDPILQSEIQRDNHQNRSNFYRIPKELSIGSKKKPAYDALKAQKYWNERIKEIDKKIQFVSQEIQ